ncbi:hypothetical protein M409DRAFT_54970 [Zasmidium cellare ATCC 36951]|uniref:Uncharacterized protein n=1 Tax=Zasmidium cellare ATCC 36951 TaxID=1080233 RepID=A0A6A6CHH1_ZASCE|nr:uncharacterized protein M409DRAFT_54970 [Zasmidium cellare ATCC 36951]KAF2166644.1 hypothetical protein M409DRAFT_54970 [Zasmidium cellare ATCC 36951]
MPTYAGPPAGYWPFRRPYNRRLPPLFLVRSKQIREEFGGYIFAQRHILLVSLTKQGLAGLFHFIGFVNCKRLVGNDDACLQVWHNVPISVDRRPTLTFYHALSWADVSALVDGEALWKCGRPEEVKED